MMPKALSKIATSGLLPGIGHTDDHCADEFLMSLIFFEQFFRSDKGKDQILASVRLGTVWDRM